LLFLEQLKCAGLCLFLPNANLSVMARELRALKQVNDALRRDHKALVSAGAKSGRIKIVYLSLPTGALMRYTTTNLKLVKVLHIWFAAQVNDHAQHAMMGH
jgi:hypothetical protein